jgi:rhodanese-related sulfurtransferase
MPVKRVTPDQAARLLEEGWSYVDVRSVPEFEAGHPAGAFNVPLLHRGPGGMTANPGFAEVIERRFPRESPLVLGCRSGQRSLRAAELLASRGYAQIVDMEGGFAGARAPSGQVECAGWEERGLPVSTQAEVGHSYRELEEKD